MDECAITHTLKNIKSLRLQLREGGSKRQEDEEEEELTSSP